jgi:hypothetical protein
MVHGDDQPEAGKMEMKATMASGSGRLLALGGPVRRGGTDAPNGQSWWRQHDEVWWRRIWPRRCRWGERVYTMYKTDWREKDWWGHLT